MLRKLFETQKSLSKSKTWSKFSIFLESSFDERDKHDETDGEGLVKLITPKQAKEREHKRLNEIERQKLRLSFVLLSLFHCFDPSVLTF